MLFDFGEIEIDFCSYMHEGPISTLQIKMALNLELKKWITTTRS